MWIYPKKKSKALCLSFSSLLLADRHVILVRSAVRPYDRTIVHRTRTSSYRTVVPAGRKQPGKSSPIRAAAGRDGAVNPRLAPKMAAADPDLDMMVIERCIATLKSSSNFQEVMDVATIMMNLRKTSTRNTKEDFVALVNDVATRAITKAEKLKAARPASELTAEEKEARRAAVARAYQKRHGVLGGGKVKKGGADSLARMSSRERRIAAAAGGGGGGGGGGGTPMSAYAGRRRGGAASAAAAEDPRQSYYERLTKQGNLAKQISVQCHGRRRIDGTLPQFEDPLFGADERSIVGAPGALAGDAARGAAPKGPPIVAWKRPKELAHRWGCKPQLFLDGADPGDVEQGALGDCWLLGAFSIVAAHGTSRLRRLVVHSDFESGVHAFTFCESGSFLALAARCVHPPLAPRPHALPSCCVAAVCETRAWRSH
jgi:hypothetical protein